MQIQNSTNTMKEKEIRAQINRISEQINIQKIYYSIKKINIMNYLKKENILKILLINFVIIKMVLYQLYYIYIIVIMCLK